MSQGLESKQLSQRNKVKTASPIKGAESKEMSQRSRVRASNLKYPSQVLFSLMERRQKTE